MSDLTIQNRESEQEVMPSFDFLLERETERNTLLAEHRAWLKEIKRDRPLPKTHYRVAVSCVRRNCTEICEIQCGIGCHRTKCS